MKYLNILLYNQKLNVPCQSVPYCPMSDQDIGWVLKKHFHVAEELLTGVISLSLCQLLGTAALQ